MTRSGKNLGEKGTFAAAAAFYALVAFEFFYMASPFAAYFYSVYGPGLEVLSKYDGLNSLITFFMPHVIVQTRSPLIDAHTVIGMCLFIGGIAVFAFGAFQIYRSKLLKKQEVTAWLYKYIRHPQYLALLVSSFGMLIVWPRYIVLFFTVTLVFIYFLLARAEENLCLRKYPGYSDYRERTGMFLPRLLESPFRILPSGRSRLTRLAVSMTAYVLVVSLSFAAAAGIKAYAIESIYGIYRDNAAFLALAQMPEARMQQTVDLALADPEAKALIADAEKRQGEPIKIIGYLLPAEFYVSEIPMHLPAGVRTSHSWPANHDPARYKIILTQAVITDGARVTGIDIVKRAINKHPIIEVHVDLTANAITHRYGPPEKAFYDGMPVPVY